MTLSDQVWYGFWILLGLLAAVGAVDRFMAALMGAL